MKHAENDQRRRSRERRFAEFRERMANKQKRINILANKPIPLADAIKNQADSSSRNRSEYEEKSSEWIQLANSHCKSCGGYGLKFVPQKNYPPCNCVFRNIFRKILEKYHSVARGGRNVMVVSSRGGIMNGFLDREYRADFEIICRKTIKDKLEFNVWQLHHLGRMQWYFCIPILEKVLNRKVDKGTFFRTVYRVEISCGRALYSVRPYALFPINAYFSYSTFNNLYNVRSLRTRKR